MKTKKANGMKRELLKFLGFSAVWMGTLAFSQMSFVHADEGSGHSGGGNITEADLRYYMGKMDTYLQSNEGKAAFPEIVAYDAAHPTESFQQLIQSTHPVVQKGELKDSNGVVRDCMSYANPGNRYFVCNSDALPNKTLENQPSFYRIVLHELFVQAGIEKPLSKDVPSVYEISSRITANVHLETYQEWVPGKSEKNAPLRTISTIIMDKNLVDFYIDTKTSAKSVEAILTIVFKDKNGKIKKLNGSTTLSVAEDYDYYYKNFSAGDWSENNRVDAAKRELSNAYSICPREFSKVQSLSRANGRYTSYCQFNKSFATTSLSGSEISLLDIQDFLSQISNKSFEDSVESEVTVNNNQSISSGNALSSSNALSGSAAQAAKKKTMLGVASQSNSNSKAVSEASNNDVDANITAISNVKICSRHIPYAEITYSGDTLQNIYLKSKKQLINCP